MTLKYKIIAIAAVLAAALLTGISIRDHFRSERLESAIDRAERNAVERQQRSDALEKENHIYKEKAAYLEQKLAEVSAAAKLQDETLKKLSADTNSARSYLQHHRRRPK